MAFFSSGTAILGGAMLGSAVIGGIAANSAANTQADAANQASQTQAEAGRYAADLTAQTTKDQLAQQKDIYNQNVERMQPFVESGKGSLAALQTGTAPGGQFTKGFTLDQFSTDPSYQWRLDQGRRALEASAAAKGTLMTGQGAADIVNYSQGAASQEYQAAFNRYQTTQDSLFNRLNILAGNSQNASAGLGANATQVSSNLANTAMGGANSQASIATGTAQGIASNQLAAGNASAAGSMGISNAISGAVGTGANLYMQNQWLNKIGSGIPGAGGGGGTIVPETAGLG